MRKDFYKNKAFKIGLAVFSALFFLFVFLFAFKQGKDFEPEKNNYSEEKPEEEICEQKSKLTGLCLPTDGDDSIISVAIDNHPDARPAFGLSQAGLVYEAEAEGSITRYLAFFEDWQKIEKIGPVRSARPYFVDWSEDVNALFVHCGGSPAALADIIKNNIPDINEFYNARYFWRSSDLSAPHNIFTSGELLEGYLENNPLPVKDLQTWKFGREEKNGVPGNNMEIIFKESDFVVEWKYNEEMKIYERYLAGEKHFDGQERAITAENVVLRITPAEVIDEELRLKMKVSGRGDGYFCSLGTCREVYWEKNGEDEREKYYISGEEISFLPGKIWIEVLRPEKEFIIN